MLFHFQLLLAIIGKHGNLEITYQINAFIFLPKHLVGQLHRFFLDKNLGWRWRFSSPMQIIMWSLVVNQCIPGFIIDKVQITFILWTSKVLLFIYVMYWIILLSGRSDEFPMFSHQEIINYPEHQRLKQNTFSN